MLLTGVMGQLKCLPWYAVIIIQAGAPSMAASTGLSSICQVSTLAIDSSIGLALHQAEAYWHATSITEPVGKLLCLSMPTDPRILT